MRALLRVRELGIPGSQSWLAGALCCRILPVRSSATASLILVLFFFIPANSGITIPWTQCADFHSKTNGKMRGGERINMSKKSRNKKPEEKRGDRVTQTRAPFGADNPPSLISASPWRVDCGFDLLHL